MSAKRNRLITRHCLPGRRTPFCLLALICWLPSQPLLAVEAADGSAALVWNLVIAFTVLIFTVASALLPLAAWQQWSGGPWRNAAAAPLLLLLLWGAWIVVAKLGDPGAHGLWPLEIFAWSMLNMIYMVLIMTAKRILEKADADKSGSARAGLPPS